VMTRQRATFLDVSWIRFNSFTAKSDNC
jgi:hypothetical protein